MNILSSSVGINTTSPNTNAILDIVSTSKGVLIPRMTTTQKIAIVSPLLGLQVFDTTLAAPSWYNGSAWVATGAGTSWGISGSTGTTAVNFLGTTDANPLTFKINNVFSGSIGTLDQDPLIFGIGTASPALSTGIFNTTYGSHAMTGTGSGANNTSIGAYANMQNTSGSGNTAIGYGTVSSNQSGNFNTALGNAAGSSAIGNNNTLLGNSAGQDVSGDFNTFVGSTTAITATSGGYNTYIGAQILPTSLTQSNNIIIADGAGVQRINVLPSGYVGLSNTAPASQLHVPGTVTLGIPFGGLGGAPSVTGGINFRNSANVNQIGILSGTTTATYTLTLPTAQGAVNSSLVNNGSGVLSWAVGGSTGWGLLGNASTNGTTNYIGTSDAQPLSIRTAATERINVSAIGNVSIGGTANIANLQLTQKASGGAATKGFLLTGTPISGAATGTGFLMSLGYNITNNKQLWLLDPDFSGSNLYFSTRFSSNFGYPLIDSISTDGTASGPVNIGTTTGSKTVIGGTYGVALAPLSQFNVNGNAYIGSTYANVAAPVNGLIVAGDVGFGTNAPTVAFDVAGQVRLRTVTQATGLNYVGPLGSDGSGNVVRGYFATGAVDMGDPGGTNTVGTASNMYNATHLKTVGNTILQITFNTPNVTSNYVIMGEMVGYAKMAYFYTSAKSTTGFSITFGDSSPTVQNFVFEFMVFNR